ncbi:MAG: glycosyl hydrolase family 79 C-terminal domain-containing protein [Solirubrobacteraceae bacterium]
MSVSIDARHPGPAVPREFLGLSFELSSLPQVADYAERGDFVTLLRSLGLGVLRFGGVSADTRVAWTDGVTSRPAWASATLGDGDLNRLARLAAKSGWHILLTIGLAHYDARAAASEARAAKAALGGWLAGIELGNEPNAYGHHDLRRGDWTLALYSRQVAAYRRAIARVAPGIPLAGPDVSGSRVFVTWGRGEARRLHPALLTGHHYPLGCHSVPAPTINLLLSAWIRLREERSLRRYVSVSRANSLPFRMDETNSVSCGGKAGVSNTFASALWAVDYIARSMGAGVVGINLQGNPANCNGYSPLCAPSPGGLVAGALRAQPEWYALLLSKALIGDRPLRSIVSSSGSPNVDIATLRAPDGRLHILIVEDDQPGSKPANVSLHVGRGYRAGRILRLTAPSLTATAGVELGGRALASDGSWREPARLPESPDRRGVITLEVAPASAALVTVSPRRAAR